MKVNVTVKNNPIAMSAAVATRAGGSGIKEVLHDDTLIGDGVADELSVNTDVIATNARVDQVEETAENAKAIAEGKATGYVFDTVEDMNAWIETNSSILKLGDNLYIRAVNVPDYWWDGAAVQQLETQKVDLTDYVKNTDYATANKAGIVKPNTSYGLETTKTGELRCVPASESNIASRAPVVRPITPQNFDYAVKTGVTTNTITLTDEEKAAAQAWLGIESGGGASLPDQTGNAGKFLKTNGAEVSWGEALVNQTSHDYGLAIGRLSGVASLGARYGGLAIGYGATTYKGAMLLNSSGSLKNNNEVGTFKVCITDEMYTLIDSSGNVPLERLTYVTDQIGDISTALTAILGE